MRNRIGWLAAGMSVVFAMAVVSSAVAQGKKPDPVSKPPIPPPATGGGEVTLTGVLMSKWACSRDLTVFKNRATEEKQAVFFAFDGTPEVASAFREIFKELIAGNSVNCEQAKAIEDGMNQRLKYWIPPGKDYGVGGNNGGGFKAITGTISESDGKKWITPSKIGAAAFKYPDGFYAPDKPFKKPGSKPLVLNVTDKLSLKFVLLPGGDFFMKVPLYALPRWADEFPLHITLTKPFWMAEIPVTQEMWDAVMGAENDFSTLKDPQRPVKNVWCKEINKFCQVLSEKNGRKVRMPGEGEWDWACRVGTSNPPFMKKYKAQNSSGKARGESLPVKSKEPNAWGIYDMVSTGFEGTRDLGDTHFLHRREDRVDPYDSCEADESAGKQHAHWVKGPSQDMVTYHETIGMPGRDGKRATDADYGSVKLRLVVEATPEEIAEMEKQEKK